MSNEYIYVTNRTDTFGDWEIRRYDQTGTFLSSEYSIDESDSYFTDLYQTPDYVYLYDSVPDEIVQFSKDTDGTLSKEWSASANNVNYVEFAENGDILYIDPTFENIYRISVEDGSDVWSVSYGDGSPDDATRMANGNFAVAFNDSDLIREYDIDSGEITNEVDHNLPTGISRDDDDNYVIGDQSDDVVKKDRDGNVIWTADKNTSDTERLYRGPDRYYGFDLDSDVIYAIDDDGNQLWIEENIGSLNWVSAYKNEADEERVVYTDGSDETPYALDGETGSVVWTGDSGERFEALSAFPSGSSFSEEWISLMELSGTAEVGDDPVEGADIIVIDDENDEFVKRVSTDSDGNWSTELIEGTYHIIAQYEDIAGDQYNTETYPYITPGEE